MHVQMRSSVVMATSPLQSRSHFTLQSWADRTIARGVGVGASNSATKIHRLRLVLLES